MTKICLIAGNQFEAETWARGQLLEDEQWFYPRDINDLLFKRNFHVLIIGSAGQNVTSSYFEQILNVALKNGKVGRI